MQFTGVERNVRYEVRQFSLKKINAFQSAAIMIFRDNLQISKNKRFSKTRHVCTICFVVGIVFPPASFTSHEIPVTDRGLVTARERQWTARRNGRADSYDRARQKAPFVVRRLIGDDDDPFVSGRTCRETVSSLCNHYYERVDRVRRGRLLVAIVNNFKTATPPAATVDYYIDR